MKTYKIAPDHDEWVCEGNVMSAPCNDITYVFTIDSNEFVPSDNIPSIGHALSCCIAMLSKAYQIEAAMGGIGVHGTLSVK